MGPEHFTNIEEQGQRPLARLCFPEWEEGWGAGERNIGNGEGFEEGAEKEDNYLNPLLLRLLNK